MRPHYTSEFPTHLVFHTLYQSLLAVSWGASIAMQESTNTLKSTFANDEIAIGVWCTLASALTTEVVASAGPDWLLIDGEHSPNDLRSIMGQLQAAGQYPIEPVVRAPSDDVVAIKQIMDIGGRSLMVPNVCSAKQAEEIVAATRYAPNGVRGFSAAHRANRFGRIAHYHETAQENQLLILQIESEMGVGNAREIAAVEGVDVLFVGPGDLSTNMGLMNQAGAPLVQKAIHDVVAATNAEGKSAGILSTEPTDVFRYIETGFRMVAVGTDIGLLAGGVDRLVAAYKR